MDGRTRSALRRGHLTCHCQLVETQRGLVLIDTGFGLRDVHDPRSRLSAFFLGLVNPELREEMTAIRQIRRLGLNPNDVRHIVLTHLDFDHAGGLDDFPEATVHLMESERESASAQKTWLDRQRFRPQQWSTQANWRVYCTDAGETWHGFERVRALEGLPPEILMVPLIGHTLGHVGVAIRDRDGWLFNAGDAYFYHEEMNPEAPRCTPGLRAYQRMMEKNRGSRLWNQQRLRALRRSQGDTVTIFCAHDVTEFERLAGRPAGEPVPLGEAEAGATTTS
jgi:glyoxylase-like metal-dependent hydrolase (beta-lactamase superfamily II)